MNQLTNLKDGLERYIQDPSNHDFLVLVKAIRNGIVYGAKVRFPHALVMVFLFKSGTVREKLTAILKMTRAHATNLASFAFSYKLLMYLLLRLPLSSSATTPSATTKARKERSADSFISGLVAGYLVFGRAAAARSSVNQQIVIYVFARVALALAKLAVAPAGPAPRGYQAGYSEVSPKGQGFGAVDALLRPLALDDAARDRLRKLVARNSWPVFASLSWALVMWLFRWYPDAVQPSLRSSMRYLYDNAETWDGLHTFIWHNK